MAIQEFVVTLPDCTSGSTAHSESLYRAHSNVILLQRLWMHHLIGDAVLLMITKRVALLAKSETQIGRNS